MNANKSTNFVRLVLCLILLAVPALACGAPHQKAGVPKGTMVPTSWKDVLAAALGYYDWDDFKIALEMPSTPALGFVDMPGSVYIISSMSLGDGTLNQINAASVNDAVGEGQVVAAYARTSMYAIMKALEGAPDARILTKVIGADEYAIFMYPTAGGWYFGGMNLATRGLESICATVTNCGNIATAEVLSKTVKDLKAAGWKQITPDELPAGVVVYLTTRLEFLFKTGASALGYRLGSAISSPIVVPATIIFQPFPGIEQQPEIQN